MVGWCSNRDYGDIQKLSAVQCSSVGDLCRHFRNCFLDVFSNKHKTEDYKKHYMYNKMCLHLQCNFCTTFRLLILAISMLSDVICFFFIKLFMDVVHRLGNCP